MIPLRDSMSPRDLVAALKPRINPLYANQSGTESHERQLCVSAIEALLDPSPAVEAAEGLGDSEAAATLHYGKQEPFGVLLAAAKLTLANNLHLADGDNCTLIELRRAVESVAPGWLESLP